MKILVIGSSGQLATHLRLRLPTAVCWGRRELDLARPTTVRAAVEAYRPSIIVNAAAYTAVDKAESERDVAWAVNAEGPAALARAAASLDVPLIHISTDYVFDGAKIGPYDASDARNPVNAYGASKLGGELVVQLLCPRAWILRTSWLFSEFGSNFLTRILQLASEQEELRVVSDQVGRPTYAGDLAELVARMVERREDVRLPFGTYNAVGGAATSWHCLAQAIVAAGVRYGHLTRAPRVVAISTSGRLTVAHRPKNSVLLPSDEFTSLFNIRFDWGRGVDSAARRLEDLRKR